MSWTYDEVMAALGDEAQAVPGAIVVFRGKHIVVAENTIGHGFSVTPEGLALLGDKQADTVASKPRKRAVKSADVVVDDIDLSD